MHGRNERSLLSQFELSSGKLKMLPRSESDLATDETRDVAVGIASLLIIGVGSSLWTRLRGQ